MLLVTTSKRMWLIGMGVSLAIFLILYLTVIKPSSDTANQAIRSGLQQSQQVLSQASKAEQSAAGAAGAAGASGQAQQTLSRAAKLTACVAAAGTDPTKLEACKSKYTG